MNGRGVSKRPAPWTVPEVAENFRVEDAAGKSMAYVYFADEGLVSGARTRSARLLRASGGCASVR
jgi:hypothetical protein